MKNLKKINVEELSAKEMQTIEGGGLLSGDLQGTVNTILAALSVVLNSILNLINSNVSVKL